MAKRKPAKKKKEGTQAEELIKLLNKPDQTLTTLCNSMDMAPSRVRALFVDIEKLGAQIRETDGIYSIIADNTSSPHDLTWMHKLSIGVHRIALLSDTHLGGHHQQLTYLKQFYADAVDQGVTRFYHSGDMCAGDGRVYQGQANEIFAHGLQHNVEYVTEHYPKYRGVTTYFITGNHDLSWWQRGGADIGIAIADRRKDMVYLGQYGAYSKLTDDVTNKAGELQRMGTRIYLHHPAGGAAYALSYKQQRHIQGMSMEKRPDILSSGHLHTLSNFTLSGVEAFQPGCFESQTAYELRYALDPAIGGWILELDISKEGIEVLRMTKWRRKTPIIKDF